MLEQNTATVSYLMASTAMEHGGGGGMGGRGGAGGEGGVGGCGGMGGGEGGAGQAYCGREYLGAGRAGQESGVASVPYRVEACGAPAPGHFHRTGASAGAGAGLTGALEYCCRGLGTPALAARSRVLDAPIPELTGELSLHSTQKNPC